MNPMMDEQQIARTLQMHKKAYELLLWLQLHAKANSTLLNRNALEEMSTAATCQDWVARHCSMFPIVLRPAADEISAFSHLFSSFFTTSFRVAQNRSWGMKERTLVAGAKEFNGRRHKRHAEQRELEAAMELKRAALTALAAESHLNQESAFIDRFLVLEAYRQDLSLWTYICELVRRTEFASQGSAVHRLWLELSEKTRKNLSPAVIFKARNHLLSGLKNETNNAKNQC